MPSTNPPFSAQVLLQPDAPQSAGDIADEFRRAGFQVGARVGNNFSISGPPHLFESYFGVPVGGRAASATPSEALKSDTLPLDRLPSNVRPFVHAIAMSRIDFGPTNW